MNPLHQLFDIIREIHAIKTIASIQIVDESRRHGLYPGFVSDETGGSSARRKCHLPSPDRKEPELPTRGDFR